MLRKNQRDAIQTSLANDFSSGVHHHATGTGKSWIALQLLLEYHSRYPKHNVYWICERKSILTEQFNAKRLRERGYSSIYDNYHIINLTDHKISDWYHSLNVSPIWGKPVLVVINRSYLTQSIKYTLVKIPFHLIIHDECHSIINQTTQAFYSYITNKHPEIKCLGFSATPELSHQPLTNLLSQYSIYDAIRDQVIVKPDIKWFSNPELIDDTTLIHFVKQQITNLPYGKIIIWAGMIKYCQSLAEKWARYFPDYKVCVDTSVTTHNSKPANDGRFINYEQFSELDSKGILFCACKHREGSDIKNLDGCVFIDGVSNRNSRAFIQCVGRVLRRDALDRKQYGLIIEIAAKSDIKICDRINAYFKPPVGVFPWQSKQNDVIIRGQSIIVNTLTIKDMLINPKSNQQTLPQSLPQSLSSQSPSPSESDAIVLSQHVLVTDTNQSVTDLDITNYFVRSCPSKKRYQKRLQIELELLKSQKLEKYLLQAVDILNITEDIPHVTRGSCGSSLVCYLLGISHTDPVVYDISFSRFLNEFRDNLPDVDFDFPYNLRDKVFLRIENKWPGKIARISNHVYYHEKSALREAIRKAGIREFISKNDIHQYVSKLPRETQELITKYKKELLDTFRCYSLHCGGIIYYPEGVPDEIKLKNKNGRHSTIDQVSLNKIDIQKTRHFKIDILSSRGLSQLCEIVGSNDIDFSANDGDIRTQQLLSSGDNIGITLAESPLIRKAFIKIAPKCIADVAICLSIIRPMASEARNQQDISKIADNMIYDDDAIVLIRRFLKCSEAEADYFRRGFAKGKKSVKDKLLAKLTNQSDSDIIKLISELSKLKKYSFCKSHAFSYAQLVWQLAYHKAHNADKFWKATINHCDSNYKKWVHVHEARLVGVDLEDTTLLRNHKSIYSKSRHVKLEGDQSPEHLFLRGSPRYSQLYGNNFYPRCYLFGNSETQKFRGIVASYRKVHKVLTIFLGVGNHNYVEVVVNKNIRLPNRCVGVMGQGKLDRVNMIITCENISIF